MGELSLSMRLGTSVMHSAVVRRATLLLPPGRSGPRGGERRAAPFASKHYCRGPTVGARNELRWPPPWATAARLIDTPSGVP
jgi:hypothetical protein